MLSVPIINERSVPSTRGAYLAELRRAGASRVFLGGAGISSPIFSKQNIDATIALFAENIAFYTAADFEVGVWISGFGHGGALAHEEAQTCADYTHLRGLSNGGEADDSFCPEDPRFFADYADIVRRLAKAGARMIMIDDDLRIALHGSCVLGCACPIHMRLFNERARAAGLADHDYTREELAEFLMTGPALPLRRIWLDLMGDTLRNFASKLRAVVDEVDPTIRLGHCACLSTWDVDGVDSIELARIFAGSTKPFLRLIGAPYWTSGHSFHTTGIGSVIDLERMQLGWCQAEAEGVEIFTEGDAYPRPRYNVPHAWLEVFDQVIGAENQADGILKYMLDYVHAPLYETGYIDRHVHFAPLRRALHDTFAAGETAGVYVHEVMRKLAGLDCTGLSEFDIVARFMPASINFANAASLPIAFTRSAETRCALIFGENARYPDDDTAALPMILDAVAAQLLTERGTDVGLRCSADAPTPTHEYFPGWDESIPVGTAGRFFRFDLADGTNILSTFKAGKDTFPAAYTYENADGQRFLVYSFDAESVSAKSALWRSYPHQQQLFDAAAWLQGGRALPAAILKEPGAYVLCRRMADGALAVGIWNFGQDVILPTRVALDAHYREIRPIAGTDVHPDGQYAVLGGVIPPYGFAGFVVR